MATVIRPRSVVPLLILSAFTVAGCWIWPYRYHWFAHNFREIERGRVYAGGNQYAGPLTRIVHTHHIKTVLSLLSEGTGKSRREQEMLLNLGVEFKQVTIPTKESSKHGCRTPDLSIPAKLLFVQQAVAILSDPQNQPVFVHCNCGRRRVGAVVAVYRVQQDGWSESAARVELARHGGLQTGTKWPASVLHAFCQQEMAMLSRTLREEESQAVFRPQEDE